MKTLEDFLTLTQQQLFAMLSKMYKGSAVVRKGEFILVRGEAPIMLLAHMDTVHKEPVRDICKTKNGNILMSPQGIGGDDRCGVYALHMVYENAPTKPWLLFTCDEEIGCMGANTFCELYRLGKLPKELDELKCIVEIDRKGSKDAVYYDCDNEDFEDYIAGKGFVSDWGTFSDISYVAPELGVAGVNLSSGYYNAHTLHEYINRRELNNTIKKVLEIVADAAKPDFPKYEYIELVHYGRHSGYYSYRWDDPKPPAKSSKKGSWSTSVRLSKDDERFLRESLAQEYGLNEIGKGEIVCEEYVVPTNGILYAMDEMGRELYYWDEDDCEWVVSSFNDTFVDFIHEG